MLDDNRKLKFGFAPAYIAYYQLVFEVESIVETRALLLTIINYIEQY
jgi:hypothetical protein